MVEFDLLQEKVLITHLLLLLVVWDVKPSYRKSWTRNLLMYWSLALVSCLSSQYNLHQFSDALDLVDFFILQIPSSNLMTCVNCLRCKRQLFPKIGIVCLIPFNIEMIELILRHQINTRDFTKLNDIV